MLNNNQSYLIISGVVSGVFNIHRKNNNLFFKRFRVFFLFSDSIILRQFLRPLIRMQKRHRVEFLIPTSMWNRIMIIIIFYLILNTIEVHFFGKLYFFTNLFFLFFPLFFFHLSVIIMKPIYSDGSVKKASRIFYDDTRKKFNFHFHVFGFLFCWFCICYHLLGFQ